MSRPDLLVLTPDDLAALANRGLVKRARKELDSAKVEAEWSEEDDTITAHWSDRVSCTLPGGQTVREATCDCAAFGMCRHIIRTILAYQDHHQNSPQATHALHESPHPKSWDPGKISDETIEAQVPKPVLALAKRLWSQGTLVELLRNCKPSARFHLPGHTVRFPVPEDIRYALCSCADPAPCVHSVLAIRAFRLLPPTKNSGLISEGTRDPKVDHAPLLRGQENILSALENGFANLNSSWRDRLQATATRCLEAKLSWPAQILQELITSSELYAAHDSSFHPGEAVFLAGEFLIRSDAICHGKAPVPQAFIRGLETDRDSHLGAARFIGLGSLAEESRTCSTIHTFLQDSGTGHLVTLSRSYQEKTESGLVSRKFHELANRSFVRDASIALLSSGQLVTQGGRRTASGRLILGRARASVSPQNYQWQHLKPPVLVEDYHELATRLQLLPPASFRPRQAAADFHVCPINEVELARFDASRNQIVAILRDQNGSNMLLTHPWTERGQAGAEALLDALSSRKAIYVAGHVRTSGTGLTIRPTMVVFEKDDVRTSILPWLDPPTSENETRYHAGDYLEPWRYHTAQSLLEDLLISGHRRLDSRGWPGWPERISELEASGYHQMANLLSKIKNPSTRPAAALSALKLLTLARDLHPP